MPAASFHYIAGFESLYFVFKFRALCGTSSLGFPGGPHGIRLGFCRSRCDGRGSHGGFYRFRMESPDDPEGTRAEQDHQTQGEKFQGLI